jgi:hypothetical protein
VRDKLSFIFILVMPLAFTLFFLLFGGSAAGQAAAGRVGRGRGAAAKQLVADLDKSPVVRVVVKTGERVRDVDGRRARRGTAHPEGYSAAVAAGKKADLTIVSTRARAAPPPRQRGAPLARAGHRGAGVAGRRRGIWQTREHAPGRPGRRRRRSRPRRPIAAQALASPALSTDVVEAGAAAGQIPSGFVLSSPGMVVNFILFSLLTAGIALIVERQNGTLQRHDHPLRRWRLIGGKGGDVLLTFAQQVLLIAVADLLRRTTCAIRRRCS